MIKKGDDFEGGETQKLRRRRKSKVEFTVKVVRGKDGEGLFAVRRATRETEGCTLKVDEWIHTLSVPESDGTVDILG